MRKKTQQTIDLMNERLRKLELKNENFKLTEPVFTGLMGDLHDRIVALEAEVDKLKVVDAAPEEPPIGSIIRDCDGYAWQRTPSGWWPISDPFTYCDGAKDWAHVQMYYGPTTLLYFNVDQELDWINPKDIVE